MIRRQIISEAWRRRICVITGGQRCAAGDLEVERVSGSAQKNQIGRRGDRDVFFGSPGLPEFAVVDAAPRETDGRAWLPFRQQRRYLVFVVPLSRLLLDLIVI